MSSEARPLTTSSALSDENALKRTFDAEFDSAIASARSQLGDATALAPRVVETAFVNAWKQRDALKTQDDIKHMLSEEVKHGSARALSRRASASRFAGGKHATGQHAVASDKPADVWAGVQKAIHAHAEEAHAAAAAAGRHEAASHMKQVTKKKSLVVPIAIGVVAIAAAIGGVIYINKLGVDDAALSAVSGTTMQPTIQSNFAQIGSTSLADGSKIRIGPDTKIFVPDGFPKKVRVIRVAGTAQVDVAPTTPEMPLPFRIVAKRNHFIATGTSFAVSAYGDDSVALVSVKEGTVTVKSGKTMSNVTAGQTMHVESGTIRDASADERAEGFNWVDGRITIKEKSMREMLGELTRWFNYDVKIIDKPLFDRRASVDVPLDSSRLAISQVEKAANVKFAYEGETKVFRDAGKPAAGTKPAAAAKPAGKKK